MEADSDVGKTINEELCFYTFAQKEEVTDFPGLKTWGEEGKAPMMVQDENGENRYACSLCEKTFKLIVHLRKHKRTHDRRRPHKCDECGKDFRDKQDLVRHHRMHTGEKPYSCPGCSQSFGRKTHLNRHLRIHTGERPYECEICGKSFSRKFILDTHYRVHRKGKLQAKRESFETTYNW